MTDSIIRQQIEYYRARASEYDEWFYRVGRYDHGPALNQQWFDEVTVVLLALQHLAPFDDVVELACGTGIWTQELAALSKHVTAIDASPEVLAINRAKLDAPNVSYQQADLFAWQPERQYDLVFFSFWLSHVPPELLDRFLATVARANRPGGRVFIIDSLFESTSTALDHQLHEREATYRTRKLNDGREFQIVKVFYQPDELRRHLNQHGFDAVVKTTEHYFLYATGTKQAT